MSGPACKENELVNGKGVIFFRLWQDSRKLRPTAAKMKISADNAGGDKSEVGIENRCEGG